MNSIFNIDDAPLWVQELVFIKYSQESYLLKIYEKYIKTGKEIKRSDRLMIQSTTLANLYSHWPFYFEFKNNSRIEMMDQMIKLPSHKIAIKFAEISGYKFIESTKFIGNIIDTNCYNKETCEWSGWETKVSD